VGYRKRSDNRKWRGTTSPIARSFIFVGANLNWLVNEAKIAPHIPVVDKSKREDGTFSREDFTFDKQNVYICSAGKGSHHDGQAGQ